MKHVFSSARSSRQSGFTLVELLVVIGIIAILASVVLSAGGAAIRAAKRASAANTATQIQTACTSYFTEYGVYPVPAGIATDYTDLTDAAGSGAGWGVLMDAMAGNINPINGNPVNPTTISNTRGIAFLSMKASDLDTATQAPKNPLPFNSTANPYFNLALDSDYDNVLGGASTSAGKLPNFTTATLGTDPAMSGTCTGGVAVWANCNPNTTTKSPGFWVHTY